MQEPGVMLSVREACEAASAAGFRFSRPTILQIFKDGGAVRIRNRYFLNREKFMDMLATGVSYEAYKKRGRPKSCGDGGEAAT